VALSCSRSINFVDRGTAHGVYSGYLSRILRSSADLLGLSYCEEQTNGGADLSVMLNALSGMEEYQACFVGMSNAEVIKSIYEALFGRAPEAEGLAHFFEALESGAQGTDLAIITNKIAAAEAFTPRSTPLKKSRPIRATPPPTSAAPSSTSNRRPGNRRRRSAGADQHRPAGLHPRRSTATGRRWRWWYRWWGDTVPPDAPIITSISESGNN
jgi:hypothetical protein